MHRFLTITALCTLGLAAGCYNATSNSGENDDDGSTAKQTGPWKADYKMVTGDWKDLKQLIDKHRGKVVVVDFWSDWCEPCKKELPHLAELQKKYGDKLVTISANLNYDGLKGTDLEKVRASADKILRERFGSVLEPNEQLNQFVGFVSNQADETLYKAAEIDSVPTILIYSKTGKRHQIDVESVKPENSPPRDVSYARDVSPLVEKLISE